MLGRLDLAPRLATRRPRRGPGRRADVRLRDRQLRGHFHRGADHAEHAARRREHPRVRRPRQRRRQGPAVGRLVRARATSHREQRNLRESGFSSDPVPWPVGGPIATSGWATRRRSATWTVTARPRSLSGRRAGRRLQSRSRPPGTTSTCSSRPGRGVELVARRPDRADRRGRRERPRNRRPRRGRRPGRPAREQDRSRRAAHGADLSTRERGCSGTSRDHHGRRPRGSDRVNSTTLPRSSTSTPTPTSISSSERGMRECSFPRPRNEKESRRFTRMEEPLVDLTRGSHDSPALADWTQTATSTWSPASRRAS